MTKFVIDSLPDNSRVNMCDKFTSLKSVCGEIVC